MMGVSAGIWQTLGTEKQPTKFFMASTIQAVPNGLAGVLPVNGVVLSMLSLIIGSVAGVHLL